MKSAAIAIIGGGILGSSVAYHLGQNGESDVILVERSNIATAASSQAAGLMFRISSKPAVDALSRTTFKDIASLENQLGASLDFHRLGTLRIAETEENHSKLMELYARAKHEGILAEIVDESWRAESLPWLDTGSDTLAVLFPDEGYIDPYRLATAYARAATQTGIGIETGMAVKSIRCEGGRVAGLENSDGMLRCEKVVIAAGATSNQLTTPLGISLPMVPTRSHFWVTAPDPMFSPNQPMTVHADSGAFTRPEVGGLLLGVQEKHSCTFDYRLLPDDMASFAVTEDGRQWDALAEAEPHISPFFPTFGDVGFKDYVAGLSAYTPDGHFILGEIEDRPGLFVAAGCCGSGVMASGGIGEALAGLLLEGESPYELTPFKPNRFGNVDPATTGFQALCARARAGKAK
jgi:glycine/D-amino acid oxidase-like deaminating enzyme